MADHLTYIEFLGLPGSGKSFFSHKVAEALREEGYRIKEPSWELDHVTGKYSRAFKKTMMALRYSIKFHRRARGVNKLIDFSGYKGKEKKRFYRNILYKAYLLSKPNKAVLMFDEGLAQMAVSLSMNGLRPAKDIYDELSSILQLNVMPLCIKIDCDIDKALQNMELRDVHDSRVEKISSLEERIEMLSLIKKECDSLGIPGLVGIPFSLETDAVVARISCHIKASIENKL